jgi:ABC-type uncharacterized transport system permease subunit
VGQQVLHLIAGIDPDVMCSAIVANLDVMGRANKHVLFAKRLAQQSHQTGAALSAPSILGGQIGIT